MWKTVNLEVCRDCGDWLACADASALDYHYTNEADASARLEEIQRGERALRARGDSHVIMSPDTRREGVEFTTAACDCCGATAAGEREPFTLKLYGASNHD